MLKHVQQKRTNYINKLVSNARAILTNQIGLPLGVQKTLKIKSWIDQIEALTEIDFSVFQDYYNLINCSPIGTERLKWNKESLKNEDQIIDAANKKYRTEILDCCYIIIDKFGKDKSEQK